MYTHNVVLNPNLPMIYSLGYLEPNKCSLYNQKDHNLQTRQTKAKILRICHNCNNATKKDNETLQRDQLSYPNQNLRAFEFHAFNFCATSDFTPL